MCHITGGTLYDNCNLVNCNLKYNIKTDENDFPYWCKYLMQKGNISKSEMLNVFNLWIRIFNDN